MIREVQSWFAPTGENFYFDPLNWLKTPCLRLVFLQKPRVLLFEEVLVRMREILEIWGMGNFVGFYANAKYFCKKHQNSSLC